MGRRYQLLLVLALVTAACGTAGELADDGGVPESAFTMASTTTTSTTLATTTTTEADPCEGEPRSIDERGLQLVPGCEYRTEQFVFPITFEVAGSGWLSFVVLDPRVAYLAIDEDQDGSADGNLAVLSYTAGSNEEPFSAVLSLVDISRPDTPRPLAIHPSSEVTSTSVAGIEAMTIDVLGDERFAPTRMSGCTTSGVRYIGGDSGDGYTLVRDTGADARVDYGIPSCVTSRVWQLTVDDNPITIVAAALDNDRFDEFMPIFEDFLENSVTFGGASG